jgi:hypothetical protein
MHTIIIIMVVEIKSDASEDDDLVVGKLSGEINTCK